MKRTQPHHCRAICEPIESRLLLSVARPAYNTGTGFFVSGGKIYDANGNEFVMKGVNAVHAWGSYSTNYKTIDQIAKTGANAARLVMYEDISTDTSNPYTDAADTPARRQAVVERYLADGMVAVVEDHASITTDADSRDPAALAEVTTHWLANASWLKQYEKGVILNIANEWGPVTGVSGSNTVWRDSYITQVQRLRAGPDGTVGTGDDVTNLIQIDAAGYGQDYNSLALYAQQILDADPQHNILFSIHPYGQWRDESRAFDVSANNSDYGPWDLLTRLSSLKNRATPLPLVIGEFAWEDFRDFSSASAPYAGYRTQRLMQIADQLDIGWTGWSYNQSAPDTLNMLAGSLNNTNYNSNADLSDWGNTIVNDPTYGLKASAKRATVFPILGLAGAPAGLPAMPAAPPPDVKFVLDTTRTNVAEGGLNAVHVRLSSASTTDVVVAISRSSGDADISVAEPSLTFTPDNWNTFQTIVVAAGADADASNGTSKVQLTATGLLTTDFSVKEIDASLPTGAATLNPVADRGYSSGGSATTLTVTSTTQPQPTGAMFLRFDLSLLGGRATGAILRIYKTSASTNLSLRVHAVLNDTWTEAGTTGINTSYPLTAHTVTNAANTYVEIDVSAFVQSELFKDGIVSLAVTAVAGSATFQTRDGTQKPQLVVTTVEAVPPAVASIAFDCAQTPNRLLIGFDEEVSASFSASDVIVQSLSGAAVPTLGTPVWDSLANAYALMFAPGVIPDGRYRVTVPAGSVADATGNVTVRDATFDFFSLAGDITRDGAVGFDDLLVLAANYGSTSSTFAHGDLTGDGRVDFDDLLLLAGHYGNGLPTAAFGSANVSSEAAPTRRHRPLPLA